MSLGVDVIPYKTCTFDCVYCECGATTELTCERREFCPVREITDDLEERLARMKERPDVVTLSGSGEPTLYRPMGELIGEIKRLSGLPVAVITNSSLLWLPEVRDELSRADIVLPSLDAATEGAYRRINRPHELCELPKVIEGLERFLSTYAGMVLFEILLVESFNTDRENLEALKSVLARMRAGRIQLNTAVRPGTERHIEPLDDESMERIRAFFGPRCEVIASARTARMHHEESVLEETVVGLLERRPCTALDIERSLGIPSRTIAPLIESLTLRGKISASKHRNEVFYSAPRKDARRG